MTLRTDWVDGTDTVDDDALNAIGVAVNGNTAAIAGKADSGHPHTSSDITGLTKTSVGLGNVDNTSDATKNAASATVTNHTLDASNTITARDDRLTVQAASDSTKRIQFDLSTLTTGVTRSLTPPNQNAVLVGRDTTDTLTHKDSTAGTNTFPTLNQNTTGTAAALTTPAAAVGPAWWPAGYVTGNYYLCNSSATAGAVATLGFGTVRVSAWTVTASVTITRLFVEHTVAQAGTTFRIGIFNDDGFGRPGTLLLDAGTVNTNNTAGVQEITVSQPMTPGLYWVGGAVQGSGTQPTMKVISTTGVGVPFFSPLGTSLPAINFTSVIFGMTGVSGALTSPFVINTGTTGVGVARVGFKVA